MVLLGIPDILDGAAPTGEHTVPDALLGCWRRNWIQFGVDGDRQDQVQVIWLQTASGMGDVRIDPAQAPHESDSSCGITTVDASSTPYVTADWSDGPSGFAQQPVSSFPEKGWLVWDSASVMRELAPSGAYVEEWERLPDSTGPTAHLVALDATTTTNLYIAGSHVFLAVKNEEPGGIHQFSWAKHSPTSGQLLTGISTIASQVGEPLNLDYRWRIESFCQTTLNPQHPGRGLRPGYSRQSGVSRD